MNGLGIENGASCTTAIAEHSARYWRLVRSGTSGGLRPSFLPRVISGPDPRLPRPAVAAQPLCVACLACVRVCPSDAVAVSAERVSIVDEACTRCGVCLPTCPHEAIRATGNLDRASADGVFELMLSLARERGTAFVLVTHDRSLAARCDRQMQLLAGRLSDLPL